MGLLVRILSRFFSFAGSVCCSCTSDLLEYHQYIHNNYYLTIKTHQEWASKSGKTFQQNMWSTASLHNPHTFYLLIPGRLSKSTLLCKVRQSQQEAYRVEHPCRLYIISPWTLVQDNGSNADAVLLSCVHEWPPFPSL